MAVMNFKVNGRAQSVDKWTRRLPVPPQPAAVTISSCADPKFGCSLGQCGSCTVIVKGRRFSPASRRPQHCERRCRRAWGIRAVEHVIQKRSSTNKK